MKDKCTEERMSPIPTNFHKINRMKKLQLIHPPNDVKYRNIRTGYESLPPPSGLAILASYVKQFYGDISIEIIDGNISDIDEIYNLLDADIIGISSWFTNHNSAMKIAKHAKHVNSQSTVVVGGPNATNLGARILNNHPTVDYVVVGDGEQALLALCLKKAPQTIPNIWYRDINQSIKFSFKSKMDLNKLPVFDFNYFAKTDVSKYDSRSNSCTFNVNMTPVPISSIRGCVKASKRGGCIFCSMPADGIRLMDHSMVWRQISHLYHEHGIRNFFETGDNFVVGDYPERLLQKKPSNLDITLRIYAMPESIYQNNISTLKRLGVKEIFIGAESIDSDILSNANKNYDISRIEESVKLMRENNIRAYLSFIFGLPGENQKTLAETSAFVKYMSDTYDNIQRICLSLAMPINGSSLFESLLSDREIVRIYNANGQRSLEKDDDIDYKVLSELSIQKYCKVSYSDVHALLSKLLNSGLRGRISGFGFIEDDESIIVNPGTKLYVKDEEAEYALH